MPEGHTKRQSVGRAMGRSAREREHFQWPSQSGHREASRRGAPFVSQSENLRPARSSASRDIFTSGHRNAAAAKRLGRDNNEKPAERDQPASQSVSQSVSRPDARTGRRTSATDSTCEDCSGWWRHWLVGGRFQHAAGAGRRCSGCSGWAAMGIG